MSNSLQKLPLTCATTHESTGETIIIRRGVSGHTLAPGLDIDRFNTENKVTPRMEIAMWVGATFGWDVFGADPDYPVYDSLPNHYILCFEPDNIA